ncbi:uncharacterized protein LOC115797519 [Archocentrus centrarchus]|uniref:uncharacterized protein LOC115797519 n=1 Tax=Archocentrus centrarchus TaxID=63155 RepID=UPI0011E9C053|nr:uncharacterized protein LOC115797519 [Archocentrus centrarchus]
MKLPGILLLFINPVFGKLIQTPVGDDVRFTLTNNCKKGRGSLNLRRKDASTQPVASLNGVWKPGPEYLHRVNQSGDVLILSRADYNDEGLYEFTCNYKDEEAYDLEMFLPSEVDVPEGEDAILPCRCVTAGQWVKSVRWRRNGEVVLQLDALSGEITYGENSDKSRVSVPSDWKRRADLTLTMSQAQLQDEGVYYCDVDKVPPHRAAVRLHVRPEISTPPGNTPQPTSTPPGLSQSSHWTWITVLITAAVTSVIVGPVAFFLGWKQARHTEIV